MSSDWDYRQLACDINVNNTLALHNTEMIKTYVALDPRVRPLIMILKHWTKQRRINDAGTLQFLIDDHTSGTELIFSTTP